MLGPALGTTGSCNQCSEMGIAGSLLLAPSPVHPAAASCAQPNQDQPQPRLGRCLQLSCEAGEDIKGTSPMSRLGPSPPSLGLHHGKCSRQAAGSAPWSRPAPSCPPGAHAPFPPRPGRGNVFPSLPPVMLRLFPSSGITAGPWETPRKAAAFSSFLLTHQPEPIKPAETQLFPASLLISDPLVRGDMIKCKIKCLIPRIWDYRGQAGWLEVEGCVWLKGGLN